MKTLLPIGTRAFTQLRNRSKRRRKRRGGALSHWPRKVLVFDTETTTDRSQRLLLGCYRVCSWSNNGTKLRVLEEGMLYADDLPQRDRTGFEILKDYVSTHEADVGPGVPRKLRLRSRREFVDQVLWPIAWKARGSVVGFNLPFDLSRIAIDAGAARGAYRGGFSLTLWDWFNPRTRRWEPSRFRPRVQIRHVDSKKAFMRFGRPQEIDPDDRRPPGERSPDRGYAYEGHLVDLRTLAHALSGEGHSLTSACKAFGVVHPKAHTDQHGVITADYIDYNRRDVQASAELLEALRKDFDQHPIDLDPAKAYSPASMAKACFRAMRLRPPLERFRSIPPERLGEAMEAFYGGRAEARIVKTPVPVLYTDFTSMYPTVLERTGLWPLIRARQVRAVDATDEVKRLLASVDVDRCFDPSFWLRLAGFALVEPDGDVLPVRAQYHGGEWNVGVNRLTSRRPLWFALPDLVASVLLTGKLPKVIRAVRWESRGIQKGLRPIKLRGRVPIDPRSETPFTRAVEQRQDVKRDDTLAADVQKATAQFLKTFANSGAYGTFVEVNRRETRTDRAVDLEVFAGGAHGLCRTVAPEEPGPYMFAIVGSLVTAGARLMLALLERCVTDAGGAYAFADTDSMAIVATRTGGLVPCHGGTLSMPDAAPAIWALSWDQVESIRRRFEVLNPYDRTSVPGSILRLEDVNFDANGQQREVWAYAISAKRYALYTRDDAHKPVILDYKEHGLAPIRHRKSGSRH